MPESMTIKENRSTSGNVEVSDFARTPVLGLAGALGAVLLVVSGRYGYFGDELYFLAAGRHLSWGYADQPPVLPLLARAMDTLAPDSLTVFRLPSVLATMAGVVLTALIARELGGGRKAQVLAAAAFAVAPLFVAGGHYLATSMLDPVLWTALLWLLVRWLRTRSDGLLLAAGVVTGFALNVKFLVLGFWAVAALFLLIFGPRDLLRRPLLWAGAGIAVVAALPTVLWQANHGWPQLEMNGEVADEAVRAAFLPGALLGAGVVTGAVMLLYGIWRLLRSAELRPYRFLGWTAVGVTLLFLVAGGRFYYASGMYGIGFAVAALEIERGQASRWWRWMATWPVFALSFLLILPVSLPLYPQSWLVTKPELPRPVYSAEEVGWPGVAGSVAAAYFRLPERTRGTTTIMTQSYWQASALDRYGRELGLPDPVSGNRGYWYLARPDERSDSVLFVGDAPRLLAGRFTGITLVNTVDNGTGVANGSQGTPIWLATGRTEPWAKLWPELRRFAV